MGTMLAAIAAGIALIACALVVVAMRAARIARARSAALAGAAEEALQTRTAQRLERLEAAHARLAERLVALESRGEARSFDQAIDLARRGASVGKLTESLGLSRGEADLIARLHGRQPN